MQIFGTRYRLGWFGRIVLQVQVRELQMVGPFVEPMLVWRDARVQDLLKPEVTA